MAVKRFRRSAGNANVVMEVSVAATMTSFLGEKQKQKAAAAAAGSLVPLDLKKKKTQKKPHPLSLLFSLFPTTPATNHPGQEAASVRKLPGQGQAQGQGGPDAPLQEVPVPGDDRRGLCRLGRRPGRAAAGAVRRVLLARGGCVRRELDRGARVNSEGGRKGQRVVLVIKILFFFASSSSTFCFCPCYLIQNLSIFAPQKLNNRSDEAREGRFHKGRCFLQVGWSRKGEEKRGGGWKRRVRRLSSSSPITFSLSSFFVSFPLSHLSLLCLPFPGEHAVHARRRLLGAPAGRQGHALRRRALGRRQRGGAACGVHPVRRDQGKFDVAIFFRFCGGLFEF